MLQRKYTTCLLFTFSFLLSAETSKSELTEQHAFSPFHIASSKKEISVDTDYAITPDSFANLLIFGLKNTISYAPPLSCLSTSSRCGSAPTSDHQRTSALISATTQVDNKAEEQTLGVVTTIVTGKREPWAPHTSYVNFANVSSAGGIYSQNSGFRCKSNSKAPSDFGDKNQQQKDGTCKWRWINASSIATKLGVYVETAALANAGFSEGLVTNMGLQGLLYGGPFNIQQGAVGVEHDFQNNSGFDAIPGESNLIGQSIGMTGNNKSLTGVQIDGSGGHLDKVSGKLAASTFWGLRLIDNLSSEFDIDIMDHAAKTAIGIGVDGFGSAPVRSGATIRDGSSAPAAYQGEGTTSTAVFNAIGSGHSGVNVVGHYNSGITLEGTFSKSQITGRNFDLYPDGTEDIGQQVRLLPDAHHSMQISYDTKSDSSIIQSTHIGASDTPLQLNPHGGIIMAGPSGFAEKLYTPPSSSSSCMPGQFADDENYHYVCVVANKRKRAALSAFQHYSCGLVLRCASLAAAW